MMIRKGGFYVTTGLSNTPNTGIGLPGRTGTGSGSSSTFNVEFDAFGFPTGTPWSVTMGGVKQSTQASQIIFAFPNGTYDFSAEAPGYSASPTSGTITVDNAGVLQDITFVANEVVFAPSGLTIGQVWYVTVGGKQYQGTGDNDITISAIANGTYTYSVQAPGGYTVSPSSGTISVNSNQQTLGLAFAPVVTSYTVKFISSGLTGQSWTVTFNGTPQSSTSPEIDFTGVVNGTYPFSITAPPQFSVSPASGNITVNGSDYTQNITFTSTASIFVGDSSGTISQLKVSDLSLITSIAPEASAVKYLLWDGTYLWATLADGNMWQISFVNGQMSTGTQVTAVTGNAGPMTTDGTYVYTSTPSSNASYQLFTYKINPSTLAVVATATLQQNGSDATGFSVSESMGYDGTFVYCGAGNSSSDLTVRGLVAAQISPGTMTVNAYITVGNTDAHADDAPYALYADDSGNLYMSSQNIYGSPSSEAEMWKYPSNIGGAVNGHAVDYAGIVFDGTYLYVMLGEGTLGSPIYLFKLDTSFNLIGSATTTDTITAINQGIAYDGAYLYYAHSTGVTKALPSDLSAVTTNTSLTSINAVTTNALLSRKYMIWYGFTS